MSKGDWNRLIAKQQNAVDTWRERVSKMINDEAKTFEREHPELRIIYNFSSEPLIRADNPVIFQEL